jgi:hypothetical protein
MKGYTGSVRIFPSLVMSLAVFGAWGQGAPSGPWVPFASTESNFKALLPAKPTMSHTVVVDRGQKFVSKVFASQSKHISCIISCTTLPKGTTKETLNNMRLAIEAGIVNKANGRQQSKGEVSVSGVKGEQLVFEGDGVDGTIWIGIAHDRMYLLSIGMRGSRRPLDEKRFFASFKLTS